MVKKRNRTTMDKVEIFVDTNMDITKEYADDNNLKLLWIPVFKNYQLLSRENIENNLDSYYEEMKNSNYKHSTSAIPPAEYEEVFSNVFDSGKDILYIHFSGVCSTATINNLNIVTKKLKRKYPKRKIYLVDTKQVSAGARLIVDNLLKFIKPESTIEDVLNWCNTEINHYSLYFVVDDIKYMQRSGRVSKTSAVFGTILNIKPISGVDIDGKISVISKIRGDRVAAKQILKYVLEKSTRENIIENGIVICDSGNEKMANYLDALFRDEYGNDLQVSRTKINHAIGVHSGPGAFGVAFYADHR